MHFSAYTAGLANEFRSTGESHTSIPAAEHTNSRMIDELGGADHHQYQRFIEVSCLQWCLAPWKLPLQ